MDDYQANDLQSQLNILSFKVRHLETVSRATAEMLSGRALQETQLRMAKEAAARAQAMPGVTATIKDGAVMSVNVCAAGGGFKPYTTVPNVSRRSDVDAILQMTAFIRRLLSPEDLGHAVTAEVRIDALEALGLPQR